MKHHDLGQLEGELLVFGGPYSNLQALEAVQRVAKDRQIAPNHIICTGDVVAYCGQPVQTVEAIRAMGAVVVAGNCEQQIAQEAADCGCGFEAGTTCDLLSAGWYGYATARINTEQRAWMAGLPDVVTFAHAGKRYGVLHGGLTDVARFIWPDSDETAFEAEWRALEGLVGPVDAVFAGHSGIPFERALGRRRWINAGVIGMPPHDGAAQTRYCLIKDGQAQIHRLQYDVEGAVQAMAQAGLNQGYHKALISGYWPSEDVLPASLRVSVSCASG